MNSQQPTARVMRVVKKLCQKFSYWSVVVLMSVTSTSYANVEGLPEIGKLIWQDNFDSLNTEFWSVDVGDGCQHGPNMCGWGNRELQWYAEDNIFVEPIPGEPGNNALVFEARRGTVGTKEYSSGKINSLNKIAVKYGVIEARVQIPDVDTGLWPAFWMLGTSPLPWPRKGEIDIMEMGHMLEERKRQGYGDAPLNNYVGSNLIFYAEGACSDQNPTCAASTAWDVDFNQPYVSDSALTDRFITYRMYWTKDMLAFTVTDNGEETMLYKGPFFIGEESTEFQEPFYILLNLAVGGLFTDARDNSQVTAPLSSKMYVDYVRVYQADGQGEIVPGDQTPPAKEGPIAVFSDTTSVNDSFIIGVDSDIYLWDTFSSEGSLEPAEGDNVISFSYDVPGNWFGGGVAGLTQPDMSAFADGELRFKIKIPADVSFRIGITDNFTNENWLNFPANETKYGLVRDGEWGEVVIPVADLRGERIALQSLNYIFAFSSIAGQFPAQPFEYAFDDIVWDDGSPINMDSDADGISDENDQCPNTEAGKEVDEAGCAVIFDTDNDGVIDALDMCPETKPGVAVDSSGCEIVAPLDSDGDGIIDETDQCPNTAPGTAVDANGCAIPLDSDNDGVIDDFDQCPNTASGVAVDATGCAVPLDSDNDGVSDDVDACPDTTAGVDVNELGCEIVVETYGVAASDAESIEFFVNGADWAVVHFKVNDGGQLNVGMSASDASRVYLVEGLNPGDKVEYFFTYWDPNLPGAIDSSWKTYTH